MRAEAKASARAYEEPRGKLLLLWNRVPSLITDVIGHLSGRRSLRPPTGFGWATNGCFLASLLLIAIVISKWGAVEVRENFGPVFFLTLLGCAWMVVAMHVFPWFGLSIGDDVGERRNPAALIGLCGATISVAIIYAAGNLGEGPSYWNNIFSAAVGTIGFFTLWFALELGGRVSVSIAEERDVATGIRFSGFMLAAGLILGRAIAGDWHSELATIQDFFRDGWPAAVLCIVAVFTERVLRPCRARPFPNYRSFGVLPAIAYIGCAWAWVAHLGRWEGMPK